MPPSADRQGLIVVPADLEAVRRLAEFLRAACSAAAVEDAAALDLELATVEAANNVVEHGYADAPGGELRLEFEIRGGEAVVTLYDSGAPAPEGFFNKCRIVPLDALSGRGGGIIQSCVDDIDYESAGGVNRLRLVKRI